MTPGHNHNASNTHLENPSAFLSPLSNPSAPLILTTHRPPPGAERIYRRLADSAGRSRVQSVPFNDRRKLGHGAAGAP